jgi:hypothetical protein
MTASRSDALVLFGVTGDLIRDDLPGTLCDGETRHSQGPGNRRRLPEIESGASAHTHDGQYKVLGRDR